MLKSNSPLPPLPWSYRIPRSDLTIQFINFGPRLSNADTALCLLVAANVAITHWGQPGPIGTIVLVAISGSVDLQLVPSNDITWYQWGTAIRGLTDFVDMYQAVQMEFDIRNAQSLVIGSGILSLVALSQT